MMKVEVVIPSHKRADNVITVNAVENCIICVPKSQEADYRRHNPNVEIVSHPDSVIGLAAKRNWIYEKFGDVMMLDDDIRAMYRLYLAPNSLLPSAIDPKTAYDIIQVTAQVAREMGAYLFGFATAPDRRNYKPQLPFRLSGYCTGCGMGLLKGSRIYFHKESVAVEDYFASLINAYYHRYAFFDTRYGLAQVKTFKNRGGLAEFRTVETEKRDFFFLRRMFGHIVEKRKESKHGKASHEWQRSIRLPF